MKFLFTILFILCSTIVFAATRFWVGGGSSANWNAITPTNWSATSGGSGDASVPGSSDDVTFNGLGAAGNTNSTMSVTTSFLSLTFTSGYTATVTMGTSTTLNVAGNFTDNTAHGWSVPSSIANILAITATSTITSGGQTFPGSVQFSGAAATKTISGNWVITGTFNAAITNVQIVNKTAAETITCNGGFSNSVAVSGTIDVIVTSGAVANGAVNSINSLTFTGGTINVGNFQWSGGTLTYTSGTVTQTAGNTLTLNTTTMNTAGMTWSVVSFLTGATVTINSLLTTNAITIGAISAVTFAGTAGWTVNNNFTCTQGTGFTMTLKDGVTYKVLGIFTSATAKVSAPHLYTSSHATNKANLSIPGWANTNANFTRIDASGGKPINTWNGVITTCTNINQITDYVQPPTISKMFVR